MKTDGQKERRRERWRLFGQWLEVYLFAVLGVFILLVLDSMENGIRGIVLYVPNVTEIAVSLVVAFVAVILDEQLGGIRLANRSIRARKRKHALLVGIAAVAVVSNLIGGITGGA